MKEIKGKKGQITVISIITLFITLLVFSVFLPQINTVLDTLIGQVDATSGFLLALIPLMCILGIFMSLQSYSQPQYARP